MISQAIWLTYCTAQNPSQIDLLMSGYSWLIINRTYESHLLDHILDLISFSIDFMIYTQVGSDSKKKTPESWHMVH